MDVVAKITDMVEPSLTSMGYRIVLLRLIERGRGKTLSLMAERLDGVIMGFDDCTDISRTMSALMDVEDPIQGAYNLEVMSPGIDRPLTREEDYERYKGYEIKLECWRATNGRRRYTGKNAGIKDGVITLKLDGGEEVEIQFAQVKAAKLVLTDELMNQHMKQIDAQGKEQNA